MIRKGLEKLIQQADPSITYAETASNGIEALEKITQQRPDFIFTDIRMPRMDGLELCRQLHEQYESIETVVISGYGDFEYARKCMSYGVKEYILKPVAKKHVFEVVQKLIQTARKNEHVHYVPIVMVDQWLTRLEEAVWHLQDEAILQTVQEMKDYYAGKFELFKMEQMLNHIVDQLIHRLNQRDIYTFELQAIALEAHSNQDCFTKFIDRVMQLMQIIKHKRKGNMKEPVEEAKAYMERNLSKELSLNEVADKLGLNPSYFSQLFKQMTDETFVHYRIKRRMEKAKRLLALPHYKITDISYDVGYADHPHFTKTFKRFTGYTPSEYRELLGID